MNKDPNILYIEHFHDGFVFRIHQDHPSYAAVIEQYDNYLPGVVSDYEYSQPRWVEFSSRYLSVVIDLTKIVGYNNIDISDIFLMETYMNIITKPIIAPTVTSAPTNHIMVIDCSGSMYNELPKIRTHLKNKIPTLVKKDDTLTIIWFSGKDQCGVLFEGAEVHGLTDLSKINATIDRYLTDVGLTGFKQPLEEVLAVVNRMKIMQHTMIFLSDGYSTIGESKSDIIKACSDLKDNLVSACFVEYSMYADHDMLQQMAEEVGGSLVQATDFSKYAFELDNMKNMSFGKRIQVAVPELAAGFEFIVGHNETGFVVAKPLDSKVSLPSNCKSYSYFDGSGDIQTVHDDVAACAVVAALIQRGQADTAVELAAKIGDVDLYRTIENSFSKQDYVKVVEQAKELAIGNKSLFGTAPKSTSLVQDPNAYCVLELLMDLADVEGNAIVLSHPEFDYKSIGQKRTAIEINGFTPKFTDASSEISARIANLTFDGERPNVSILVKRTGTVSLPENNFGLGTEVQSYIWRNYSIIKDGIVNVSKLPVKLTYASYNKLISRGLKLAPFKIGEVYVIDVAALPVINRSMVTGVTAQWLFNTSFLEYSLESQQKYIKTLIDKPEVGAKFAAMYGEEAALFLKEYGITEGGFSPKTAAAEETDKYVAKVLTVKMAGMSAVPKVSDVQAAIAKGKALTPSQQVMCEAIDVIETSVFEPEVLLDKTKSALKELRRDLVKAKFGVILGRKWFSDLAGYDDTVREMDFGLSKKIKCEVVMSDKLV